VSFLSGAPPVGGPLGGLVRGAAWQVLARLGPGPRTLVVPSREDAEHALRGIRYHAPELRVRLYPADDGRPWEHLSPDPALARLRLAARSDPAAVVVVPARALLLRVPAVVPTWPLARGRSFDRAAFLKWATAAGYLVTQKVDEPGTVAVRGGVMDVWPADDGDGAAGPLRVELFDDEVEAVRRWDPAGKRRPVPVGPTELLPAREAVVDAGALERAARLLADVAAETDRPGQYRRVLQDLREGLWFPGAEDYLPALAELSLPRFPGPTWVLEPDQVRDELRRFEASVAERWAALEAEERPFVRPWDRYAGAAEVRLDGTPVTALGGPYQTLDNRGLRVGTELDPTVRALRQWARAGRAVTVVVESATRAERVHALFAAHDTELPSGRAGPGEIRLDTGDLPEGFQAEDLVYVTADELFGERLHAPSATATRSFRRASRVSFASVKLGDLVVHARHGIGRYVGLARMPLGAGEGDFVTVEYRDGEKLYVPVHRLDLLAPYVADGAAPRLDRLGGATFEARKASVREAVLKLAADLLLLYARRELAAGRTYEGREEEYLRFEEAFPYVETPDQEVAIRDVLEDLASGKPMDRLIVGDVGFGKTEVAMRAAFRVVLGGDQVAVLCPTSILAMQHGETFRRRFAEEPVRIEVLSRLRSAADTRRVIEDLAAGRVDVLIGTTALLASAVRFARLGLLVVDEEHRFGSKQKEQLKRLARGVHTLAMSATPIPRTLQMALSGIRGLSVLATAPYGRQQIRTEVVRFSAARIREDMLYELRRGGQVFFVHNRVQSIQGVARWLAKLVPEAHLVVAHGQMDDRVLERALGEFIEGRANVLVSTAIIESGVDLPLVNTMLINRAELLGTAQLYQLRGRVGRGTVRGHCTVLVSGAGAQRKTSMERLRALQEHTELGSNFALAARDLELRGSGEILGEKQHGHIAAIGFDAYLELLEEAVARARGEAERRRIDPEVEVPVPCALPDAWIPDVSERLDAYQRLALARTRAEVRAEVDRLEASYGEAPAEALNLGWLNEARVRCQELGIERFAVLKVRAVVRFHASTNVAPARVDELCAAAPQRFRRLSPSEVEVRFTPDEGQLPFRLVDWVAARLAPAS